MSCPLSVTWECWWVLLHCKFGQEKKTDGTSVVVTCHTQLSLLGRPFPDERKPVHLLLLFSIFLETGAIVRIDLRHKMLIAALWTLSSFDESGLKTWNEKCSRILRMFTSTANHFHSFIYVLLILRAWFLRKSVWWMLVQMQAYTPVLSLSTKDFFFLWHWDLNLSG